MLRRGGGVSACVFDLWSKGPRLQRMDPIGLPGN